MEYHGHPVAGAITPPDLLTLRVQVASKIRTREHKYQIKALLQKHGITKLSELPLINYHAFQEEVEAIV